MRRAILRTLAVMLVVSTAQSAAAQTTPSSTATAPTHTPPPIVRTGRNTFVYDHLHLTGATDAPFALEIGDGELFQVIIEQTDPTLFRVLHFGGADGPEPRDVLERYRQ